MRKICLTFLLFWLFCTAFQVLVLIVHFHKDYNLALESVHRLLFGLFWCLDYFPGRAHYARQLLHILICSLYDVHTAVFYVLQMCMYFSVVWTRVSYELQWHMYYSVVCSAVLYVLQCQIYYSVIRTTVSYVLQYCMYCSIICYAVLYALRCWLYVLD